MENELDLTHIIQIAQWAGKLKRIKRAGWVLQDIKNPESVAEHSYRVAFLAMLLSKQHNLDILKLVKMALIHDLAEAITGDIKWEEGTKVLGDANLKNANEEAGINEIFGKETNFAEYISLWKEFEEQKTGEAKFLKELDKLEMVMQALEYQREGYDQNRLSQFWENAEKYLKGKSLGSLFEKLQELKDL